MPRPREHVLSRVERRADARVTYDLKNADPRPVPWGPPGSYLPERVEVTYRMADSKPGTRLRVVLDSVTLHGHRLKKDGTPGLKPQSEFFHQLRLEDAPAIVREAVALAAKLMADADAPGGQ